MKRHSFVLIGTLVTLIFASCDEMFTVLPEGVVEPSLLELSRTDIAIMEGDSLLLTTAFEPANVYNSSVYWMSDNPAIASVRNGMLTGVSMGQTKIYAISVLDNLKDSCTVEVFPHWQMPSRSFRYDMPIYADVTIGRERLNDRMIVGAFCGEELRGVGVMHESHGIPYLALRTYSNSPSGDELSFRCYHRDSICFVDLKEKVSFDQSKPVGTLASLFQLTGNYPKTEFLR